MREITKSLEKSKVFNLIVSAKQFEISLKRTDDPVKIQQIINEQHQKLSNHLRGKTKVMSIFFVTTTDLIYIYNLTLEI